MTDPRSGCCGSEVENFMQWLHNMPHVDKIINVEIILKEKPKDQPKKEG